ncbi:MAG: hypothetical protein M1812_006461 [Candelaria pacifica]|nr:MAG: hypothetical protein M1812_006461 [Candelaria pacifica]
MAFPLSDGSANDDSTSPSVYLAYHDISASNFCGQVGSKHTSVTLALNPEDVSSVEGFDYHDHHVSTNRFNFADLPCPPPAVLAKYTSDWANANLPFNPTFYAPYIDPPSALLQLDPAWKTCDYHSLMQFDPPRALTPEAAQKPAMEQKPAITTPAGQVVTPTPATPSPQPQALPIQTPSSSTGAKDPGVKDSGAKDSDAKDPNAQGSASQDPGAKNSGINDSGAKDPNAQGSASQDPGAKDSGAKDSGAKDPNAQSSASQDPGANNSGTKDSGVQNPAGTADPGKSQTQQGQQDDQGQGKGQPGQQGQAAQQGQQNQQDQPSQQGQQGQQNTSGQQGNQGSQDKSGQQQNPAQSASGGASPSNLVYNQPAIVIQSETLQANGPAVTISDQRFVYSAGSLYVGTSPGVVINPTPAIQVQQSQDQAGPSSQQGIQAQPGNQDQQQNYNPVVIAGQTIQIIPVQSPTLPLNQGISPTYLTAFAGQPVSSNSYGVMVGSQPITAGAPRVVFSGSSISLNTNGLLVVGSTQTFAVGPSPSPSLAALAIVGGQPVIQNNAGNVVVAGSQLTPGGPTVTISGTPVFINSQSGLVIGSQTVTRIQAATPLSPPTTLAAAGGVPIVRLGPSDIQLGSSRLIPGGSTVTVSGTPVYLDSSTNLVIGSRTVAAAASSTTSPPMTLATVGGQPIVIHNPSNIEVGGTQLDAGGSTITVNGTPVHLDSSTKLVVGSQIITFAVVATQTSAGTDGNGLGGVILSGLGGIGPQQTSSTLATATSTGNGSFNFQTYRGIANRNTGDATFFAILGVLTVAVLALT